MIKYEAGNWGIWFIFSITGSVFPKAICWALPNAALAVGMHMLLYDPDYEAGDSTSLYAMSGLEMVWGSYTFVLGFLVVFRNNQAYTRFWEGATLINQVRGEWFNAVSSLFAWSSQAPEKQEQVHHFQQVLVRLASMLYCSALQQVCDLSDDTLEIIDTSGMDMESLAFLEDVNDRCEVIIQWMQRLIVDSEREQVIKIAPPILSRAYQELSRGIVNLNNARKIKDIPFPFPYAQMITCMLLVHWVVTPLLASQMLTSPIWAGLVCFAVTEAFWCLLYIALEIDQPFGEDANDLPIREMQRDFNRSLLTLLEPLAQRPPGYIPSYDEEGPVPPSLHKSNSAIRSTVAAPVVQQVADGQEDGQYMLKIGNRRMSAEGASTYLKGRLALNGKLIKKGQADDQDGALDMWAPEEPQAYRIRVGGKKESQFRSEVEATAPKEAAQLAEVQLPPVRALHSQHSHHPTRPMVTTHSPWSGAAATHHGSHHGSRSSQRSRLSFGSGRQAKEKDAGMVRMHKGPEEDGVLPHISEASNATPDQHCI
mmetsp:Transcript_52681/g.150153  ORF Transcript_52681/g.150153 Transcript_52681/m.150153 type:complete len:538 (+) Transcript_52681:103-1716(+)